MILQWRESARRSTLERAFFAADLEAISTVDGLDVEDLATCHAKDAFDRRGHVFVHAIGELDHYHRPLARSTNQAARYGARAAPKFPENDLHTDDASTSPRGV